MQGPTGSLDESRVGVIRDKRDGQLSKVELQRSRDNVDVLISAGRDVGLLAVWSGERGGERERGEAGGLLVMARTACSAKRVSTSPLSKASLTSSTSSLKPEILYKPSDWRPVDAEKLAGYLHSRKSLCCKLFCNNPKTLDPSGPVHAIVIDTASLNKLINTV